MREERAEDDHQGEGDFACLHCYLLEAIASWSIATDAASPDGMEFMPALGDVVEALGALVADIAAHCDDPEDAKNVINSVTRIAVEQIAGRREANQAMGSPFMFRIGAVH